MGIAKQCTHLHPAPSISTQLYLPPSSSTKLRLPPSSSFQPPPSSLQHSQHSYNQNIACNWELGNFSKLRLKNSKFSIFTENWHTWYMEVVIPNPNLKFWNSDLKFNFWANLGRKSKKFLFCLKIDTHSISRMLIFIQILDFWISSPKSLNPFLALNPFLDKFRPQYSKLSVLPKYLHAEYL